MTSLNRRCMVGHLVITLRYIMECVDIVYYNFVDLFQCLLVCSDHCLSSFSFPPSFTLSFSPLPLSLPVIFPSPLSPSPLIFPSLSLSSSPPLSLPVLLSFPLSPCPLILPSLSLSSSPPLSLPLFFPFLSFSLLFLYSPFHSLFLSGNTSLRILKVEGQ